MGKPKHKFDTSCESLESQQQLSRKKFNIKDLHPFVPKTENQKKATQYFWEQVPLLTLHGYAGVGKTYVALSLAFQQALQENKKVVIVRSAVQSREIGFTSGDLAQKEEPYEQIYRSIIADIFKFNDPYMNLKQLGYVEFHSTSFIRGKTFDNAIIILDEFQNCDYEELYSVVTRCGVNSRIILCGDLKQEDLSRNRGKQMSGVTRFMNVIKQMSDDYADDVAFGVDDIVRSGLVKEFIIADNSVS